MKEPLVFTTWICIAVLAAVLMYPLFLLALTERLL